MSATRIARVVGRRVWDSRGRPTVEAEVHLERGATGRAIAPAGASKGSGEALDMRDGGTKLGGYGVQLATAHVNGEIAARLEGMDANDLEAVDSALVELDGSRTKRRLGGNALIAVSMAVAHAAASAQRVPLWKHLHRGGDVVLPLPEIQIFGGGAHAGRRLDIQDLMVVARGATCFDQALEWTAEVYLHAGKLMADAGKLFGVADEGGYWPMFATNDEALETLVRAIEGAGYIPGEQIAISLDVAAGELRHGPRYRLGLEDRELDSDSLCEMLTRWIDRYPVVSIEDPLAEDDPQGWQRLTAAVGNRLQIVGDDFLVTNAERVRAAARLSACNALLVKPNQAGTLTEARAALEAARNAGWGAIVSARSGETEDVTIVHLAVGWGVKQIKVGAFARSERMAKWNEALRIEASLAGAAKFDGGGIFRFE